MKVVSLATFRVGSLRWQPRAGSWTQTAVCKITYDLQPGTSSLAAEQIPVYPIEQQHPDDPTGTIWAPADIFPMKASPEVMLVGSAYAPDGMPVTSLVARLIVGEVDKAIELHGDQHWTMDGVLKSAGRFHRMPLRYERAGGGPESDNPVGRAHERDARGRIPTPNIVPLGTRFLEHPHIIDPVGFGPIAQSWPARRRRLGPGSDPFDGEGTGAGAPPPAEPTFFNAAPDDQRLGVLRPDERIILENLHPRIPRLVTSLPGLTPRAFIKAGGAVRELALVCDTLWIDTDAARCTLTYRGQLELTERDQHGCIYIAAQAPGERLSWLDVRRQLEPDDTDTAVSVAGAALPTATLAGGAPDADRASSPGTEPPPAVMPRYRHETIDTATIPSTTDTAKVRLGWTLDDALPFSGHARAPDASQDEPVPDSGERGHTVISGVLGGAALPFAAPALRPRAAPPPPRHAEPRAEAPSPPPPAASSHGALARPPSVRAGGSMPPPPPAVRTPPLAGGSAPAQPRIGAPNAAPSAPRMSPWGRADTAAPVATEAAGVAALAAASGVLAAMDAARRLEVAVPEEAPSVPSEPAPPSEEPPGTPTRIHKLLWFDPAVAPRLHEHEDFKMLVADLELRSIERGEAPPSSESGTEARARRDVFEVLARGTARDMAAIRAAVRKAIGRDGKFEPPLVLTGGALEQSFDRVEALKATVVLATPFQEGDRKLQEAITGAQELLSSPLLTSAPELADRLRTGIEEAFDKKGRSLPKDYLPTHTNRVLLEERRCQQRTLFGKKWVRLLLSPDGSGESIPSYLPHAVREQLPLLQRFDARLLVEVDLREDEVESHALSLRVVGLARVLAMSELGGPTTGTGG